jgi:hypothetical protein
METEKTNLRIIVVELVHESGSRMKKVREKTASQSKVFTAVYYYIAKVCWQCH